MINTSKSTKWSAPNPHQQQIYQNMNNVIIGSETQMLIRPVNVIDQPVQQIIKRAYTDGIKPHINKSQKLIHNPGFRHMGVWHQNQIIQSDIAENEIKSMTTLIDGEKYQGRPATIEELASYEYMFHEELKKLIILALGEKIYDEYVGYRRVFNLSRLLNLCHWRSYNERDGFLVVFEKIPKPE